MIKRGWLFSLLAVSALWVGAQRASALSITVATPNNNQVLNSINDHVMMNGTVSLDAAESVTITASVSGKTKSTTVTASGSVNLSDLPWYLDWSGLELNYGTSGGAASPIVVTATDADESATANYTGEITYGAANLGGDAVAMLELMTRLLQVRFAGTIFVPEGTQPGVAGKTQNYTYHQTLDSTHEVWTKTIASKNYPFLVEFFPLPDDEVVDGHYNSI